MKSKCINCLSKSEGGALLGHFYTIKDGKRVIGIVGTKAVIFVDEDFNELSCSELEGTVERNFKLLVS